MPDHVREMRYQEVFYAVYKGEEVQLPGHKTIAECKQYQGAVEICRLYEVGNNTDGGEIQWRFAWRTVARLVNGAWEDYEDDKGSLE